MAIPTSARPALDRSRAAVLDAVVDIMVDDESFAANAAELDHELLAAIGRGQGLGFFRQQLSAAWILECLYALVYVAWEEVAAGRLAPNDAPALVMESWTRGTGGPS